MYQPSFLIVGASGYIASRHIKAIQQLQGEIKGLVDIKPTEEYPDFFPEDSIKAKSISDFFNIYSENLDYIVICSPNFLHEEHIIDGLNRGADIISEKPVCLSYSGIEKLTKIEKKSKKKINCILQLRLHPLIKELKKAYETSKNFNNEIDLIYVAKRDQSYFETWKGDLKLSGGLLMNLGVHYFDILLSIFGDCVDMQLYEHSIRKSSGELKLKKGKVSWLFSFEEEDVEKYLSKNESAFRLININGDEIDFTDVSDNLHVQSYEEILLGNGFTLKDATDSIALIDKINNLK